MTRETKLGLVVASSFVALTTVVVVSRLKQAREPAPDAAQPAAIVVTAPPKTSEAPPPNVPGGSVPIQDGNAPKVLPAAFSEATPVSPVASTGRPGDTPNPVPAPPTTAGGPHNGNGGDPGSLPFPAAPVQVAQNGGTSSPPAAPSPAAPAPLPNATAPINPDAPDVPTPIPAAPAPGIPTMALPSNAQPAADGKTGDRKIPPSALGDPPPAVVPVPGADPLAKPNVGLPAPGIKEKGNDPLAGPTAAGTLTVPGAPSPANPASKGVSDPLAPTVPSPTPAIPSAAGTNAGPVPSPSPLGGVVGKPGQDPIPSPAPGARPSDPIPGAPVPLPGPNPAGPTNPQPLPMNGGQGNPSLNPAPAPGGPNPQPGPATIGASPPANPTPGAVSAFPAPTPAAPMNPVPPAPLGGGQANPLVPLDHGVSVKPAVPLEVAQAPNAAAPAVGAPANVGSPPIKVPEIPRPAVSTQPSVKIWDVQTYTCKQGDTSLEQLSERFYKSKDYAQALLRYNQESLQGAEELRTTPPQLRPGTRIQVPPVGHLESRYPDAIPNLKPLPDVPTGSISTGQSSPLGRSDPPQAPVVAATPPVAVPTPGQVGVVPTGGSGAGTKVYRVGASAEPLYLIAQQRLGDGKRWTEIYRLNPNIEPGAPIPAGTQLVLPPDARGTP